MEDTLGVLLKFSYVSKEELVLILVLMEDTLGGGIVSDLSDENRGLNPCFNGRYSRSPKPKNP